MTVESWAGRDVESQFCAGARCSRCGREVKSGDWDTPGRAVSEAASYLESAFPSCDEQVVLRILES